MTNVVQRDECFLSSVDLNEDVCSRSPATRFLVANYYASDDGAIETDIHLYAFSAKVQTHCTYNPSYKNILRLPKEERKLWDVAMMKELKNLGILDHLKWCLDQEGGRNTCIYLSFQKETVQLLTLITLMLLKMDILYLEIR